MSDFFDPTAELRAELDETDNQELIERRRQLEEGAEQPVPETIESFDILTNDDVLELGPGEFVELSVAASANDVLARVLGDEGVDAMLVIRQLGVTDNTFSVHIDLGVLDRFPEVVDPLESDRFVKTLSFFDHVDGEMHPLGMLLEAGSPLGHYFIDVASALETIAPESDEFAVRFWVEPIHERVEPTVPFRAAGISLDLVAGVRLERG